MEPVGAVSEMGWSSFNAIMYVEESDIMAQLLGPSPFTFEQPPIFLSEHEGDFYHCSNGNDTSSYYWSQMYEGSYLSDPNLIPMISSSAQMNFCITKEQITPSSIHIVSTHQSEDPIYLNEEVSCDDLGESNDTLAPDQTSPHKRKFHASENSAKKKTRTSAHVQRNTKNAVSKKVRRIAEASNEEESNVALDGQSTGYCSSDDDLNATQELNGGGSASSSSKRPATLNLSGKTRAGRGSATDPQSLYARRGIPMPPKYFQQKRRERISERLRTLQNLVPNGTKVDISTMLEEAVQYVKFLQLQIKILSSDELWMYAPIAYNSIDIGINLKISPPQ